MVKEEKYRPLCDRHVPRKPRPSGRGQGAQYKRKLPYREASPFRAGSFNFFILFRTSLPALIPEMITIGIPPPGKVQWPA